MIDRRCRGMPQQRSARPARSHLLPPGRELLLGPSDRGVQSGTVNRKWEYQTSQPETCSQTLPDRQRHLNSPVPGPIAAMSGRTLTQLFVGPSGHLGARNHAGTTQSAHTTLGRESLGRPGKKKGPVLPTQRSPARKRAAIQTAPSNPCRRARASLSLRKRPRPTPSPLGNTGSSPPYNPPRSATRVRGTTGCPPHPYTRKKKRAHLSSLTNYL